MKKKKKKYEEHGNTYKYLVICYYALSLKTRDNMVPVSFKITAAHTFVQTIRKRPKLARLCIHDSAEEEVVHSWPSSRLTSRINSWSYTCTYTRTLISLPSKKRVPQNHAPPSS